ncbi:transposase [Mesorhizobium sp. M1272]|uniref:transposase n=1 Tax=Mesorhizobium sp. M1272 TaxID=2957074 RepID=UPI003334FE78
MEGAMNLQDGLETSESRSRPMSRRAPRHRVIPTAWPLKAYCTGLLCRASARVLSRWRRVQAAHQSLHHFVAKADWSDDAVLSLVRAQVLPALERQGQIRAWIVDDTGFPKKGSIRWGLRGSIMANSANRTTARSRSLSPLPPNRRACRSPLSSICRKAGRTTAGRREKAGVPENVIFHTKPEIALTQVRAALDDGVSPGFVLAGRYGNDTACRTGLTEMGFTYVVGVQSSIRLLSPGTQPLPPNPWSGRGRPPSLARLQPGHAPVSAKELAQALPENAWRRRELRGRTPLTWTRPERVQP